MTGLPEELANLRPDARLIVLHPNYVSQRRILAHFLNLGTTVYVRFNGKALDQTELEAQLTAEGLLHQGEAGWRGVEQLILDECDCANPSEFANFLSALLQQFATGRIIIATRQPPHAVLEDDQLRAQMQFLPVDEDLMLWDYARRGVKSEAEENAVLLEVRALGNGRVLKDGKSVNNWDGLLPRSLFFYLVDKGMTTRNDIFATFWPNLSVREATNVFHVTKRKISEVLGTDLTEYWSGFYHISPKIELSYDVVRFSELFQDSAVASVAGAVDLLRQSVAIYRDDFLTSLDMDWANNRRRELRQTYGEALIGLGKALEEQGKIPEALGLYLRATPTNPNREDVALYIMKLYQSLDMPVDALLVYERLEAELSENVGIAPNRQLQELAGQLERVQRN